MSVNVVVPITQESVLVLCDTAPLSCQPFNLERLGVCKLLASPRCVLPSPSIARIRTLAQMSVQDFACNNRIRWKKLTYGKGAFLENLSKCASCTRGRGQACVFLGEPYN
jgi:hypothetical protein